MKITKLVRDRIPELMQQQGKEGAVEHIDGTALEAQLRHKLIEEAREVSDATDLSELVEELADVQEVMTALATHHQIQTAEIEEVRKKKLLERGGFTKGYLYTYDDGAPSS